MNQQFQVPDLDATDELWRSGTVSSIHAPTQSSGSRSLRISTRSDRPRASRSRIQGHVSLGRLLKYPPDGRRDIVHVGLNPVALPDAQPEIRRSRPNWLAQSSRKINPTLCSALMSIGAPVRQPAVLSGPSVTMMGDLQIANMPCFRRLLSPPTPWLAVIGEHNTR